MSVGGLSPLHQESPLKSSDVRLIVPSGFPPLHPLPVPICSCFLLSPSHPPLLIRVRPSSPCRIENRCAKLTFRFGQLEVEGREDLKPQTTVAYAWDQVRRQT